MRYGNNDFFSSKKHYHSMYKLFYNRDINCITLHTRVCVCSSKVFSSCECEWTDKEECQNEREKGRTRVNISRERRVNTSNSEDRVAIEKQGSNKQHIVGAARVGFIILPLKWTWIVSDIENPKTSKYAVIKVFSVYFVWNTSHGHMQTYLYT